MESKLVSNYQSLNNSLTEMREEYEIMPSTFLLKKIELVQTKIKQIDSLISHRSTSGGGNYQSIPDENINFSL